MEFVSNDRKPGLNSPSLEGLRWQGPPNLLLTYGPPYQPGNAQ